MAQSRSVRGCGCVLVVLGVIVVVGLVAYFKFYRPAPGPKLPPPSGDELSIHVLDVGQGDAILIVARFGHTLKSLFPPFARTHSRANDNLVRLRFEYDLFAEAALLQ